MSLRIQCPNGHKLVAKDELAGRRIRCPKCKVIVMIPAPVEEVVELPEDAIIEEIPEGPADNGLGSADPLFADPQADADAFASDPLGDNAFADLPGMDSIPTAPVAPVKPLSPSAARSPSGPATRAAGPTEPHQESLSGGLIAACVTSIASLVLGLILLVALLVTRGGNASADRQVAQIDAEDAVAERGIVESSTESSTNDKEPSQAASSSAESSSAESASSSSAASDSGSGFAGTLLPIKASGSAIAFDSLTGDLAVASGEQEFLVYRHGYFAGETTAVSDPVKVDSDATVSALCFKPIGKRNLLLASDGEKMWMYDAESLQLFNTGGKIPNPITVGASGLFSSSNRYDRYVYTSQTQFEIAPLICEKRFRITQRGNYINPASLIYGVSPSGRLLYRASAATLAYPTTFAGDYFLAPTLRHQGNDVDPVDQIVCSGGKIMPIGKPKDTGIAVDAGRMICYLPNTPWLVFIDNEVLTLVHRDTGATHPLMTLPESMAWKESDDSKKSRTNENQQNPIHGFYDVHHDRLLLCRRVEVASIEMNQRIPDDPLLAVRVDIPPVMRPGQELSVAVAPSRPDVKVSLTDSPEGMQLTDGILRWTPSRADVGKHTLKLRCESGVHLKDQEVDLVVSELAVDLPFATMFSAISREGTHILAWSYDPLTFDFRFAYVNARTRQVRVSEPQTGSPRLACADAKGIYFLTTDSNLLVFDPNTMELKKSRYLTGFASGLSDRLSSSKAGMLVDDAFLRLQNDSSRHFFLQLPDLKPLKTPAGEESKLSWRRLADGRYAFGGAVFDDSMKSIDFFLSIQEMVGLNPSYTGDSHLWQPRTNMAGAMSKRISSVSRPKGTEGYRAGPGALIWSEKSPGDIYASVWNGIAGVHVGRKLFPLVLKDGGQQSHPAGNPMLPSTDDALGIRPMDAPLILSTRKATTLRYEGINGRPPYQFEARIDSRAVDKNAYNDLIKPGRAAGTFVIDGPNLGRTLLSDREFGRDIDRRIQSLANQARSAKGSVISEHYRSNLFKSWSAELQPKFTKFPIAIPILLSVTDSDNRKTTMTHTLVMDLPADRLIALIRVPLTVDPTRVEPQKAVARMPGQPPEKPSLKFDAFPADEVNRQWFSNWIRQRYREKQLTGQKDRSNLTLKHRALRAVLKGTASNSSEPQRPMQRTWRKLDGSQIAGTLKEFSSGRLTIEDDRGRRHFVSPNELDVESLEAAWDVCHRVNQNDVAQAYIATVGRSGLGTINRRGLGLRDFLNQYRFQVPTSLDDADGTPLLSWRVLVLPYFGYMELYDLFNLEEPWDSPHNRQLLPYMPLEYSIIPHVENAGRTPFLAPVGPHTPFPQDRLVRYFEFRRPSRSRPTICVFTVKHELAVPWTKPADLDVAGDEFPREKLTPLGKIGRDKKYYVLSYDGEDHELNVESNDPRLDLREGASLPRFRKGQF